MSESRDDLDPVRLAMSALVAVPAEVAPPSESVRAKAIDALGDAIVARARRRRRRTVTVAFGLAAAVIVAAFGGAHILRARPVTAAVARPTTVDAPPVARAAYGGSGVSITHDGKSAGLEGSSVIVPGDRVVANGDGHAAFVLPSGTVVAVEPQATVDVISISREQRFSLSSGSASFTVTKLHDGERFLVQTSDAEIEVRGTVFQVALVAPDAACGDGTPTRVVVTEGTVTVRRGTLERRVGAGERWPAGCAMTASSPAQGLPPVLAQVPVPSASASTVPAASTATIAIKSSAAGLAGPSSLADQNDIMTAAMAAKRRGDRATALAGFERYLAKYPGGGLSEIATVERMRLLSGAAAASAAKSYLSRYPHGFARAEAERIAGG